MDFRKKKSTKLQLQEANSSKAKLERELENAQETIRALQTSLSARRGSDETDSIQFENNLGPTSTAQLARRRNDSSVELSQFAASMHQMSVSSVCVPECKPAVEGEDISRLDFETWRELLINSMTLAGISDEATKFVVLKVKAGPKLLEIYKGTVSSCEAPSEVTFPFSNAMFRLTNYFASASDIMLQRRKLALMSQGATESDQAFIRRVGIAAQLCDYPEEKKFDEVLNIVASQAKHKEVRVAALKMMNRNKTMSDLIDEVRQVETIRLNEEFVARKQANTEALTVNAVQAVVGRPRYVVNRSSSTPYGRTQTQRTNGRGGKNQLSSSRGAWRGSNSLVPERCSRCNSVYHSATNCFAKDMVCHNCGRKGHLQRACTFPVVQKGEQTTDDRGNGSESREVAAIGTKPELTGDDSLAIEKVSGNAV